MGTPRGPLRQTAAPLPPNPADFLRSQGQWVWEAAGYGLEAKVYKQSHGTHTQSWAKEGGAGRRQEPLPLIGPCPSRRLPDTWVILPAAMRSF